MTRTSWRYGLRLIGDETGGTGFVELLMVVACVSFLVIGGVGALGDSAEARLECEAGRVTSLGGRCGTGHGETSVGFEGDSPQEPPRQMYEESWGWEGLPKMRSWGPSDSDLTKTFDHGDLGDEPPMWDQAVSTLGAGFGNGVLTLGELLLRIPDTIRRSSDAVDSAGYALWGVDPPEHRLPSTLRLGLDGVAHLFNKGADALAKLRQRQSASGSGFLLAEKHAIANQALEAAAAGDFGPIADVLVDLPSWTGFAGGAIPSLAAMTVGGTPVIVGVTSAGVTAQIDAYEKRTGTTVEPLHYGATVATIVPVSTALEMIGVSGVRGGSLIISMIDETGTEMGQTLVENTVMSTIDEEVKLTDGVLAAGMSGLSGPMVSMAARAGQTSIRSLPDAELQVDRMMGGDPMTQLANWLATIARTYTGQTYEEDGLAFLGPEASIPGQAVNLTGDRAIIVNATDDAFYAGVHATREGPSFFRTSYETQPLTAAVVAERMRDAGYDGGDVVLLACEAGSNQALVDELRQELSGFPLSQPVGTIAAPTTPVAGTSAVQGEGYWKLIDSSAAHPTGELPAGGVQGPVHIQ